MSDQQNQQQSGDKVEKKYLDARNKLAAAFGGELAVIKLKKGIKLPKSDLDAVISEVIAEQITERKLLFKEKAKKLIISSIDFDKFENEQKKIFEKAMDSKKEELTKEIESTFQLIEGIDQIKAAYLAALTPKVPVVLVDVKGEEDIPKGI